MKRAKKESVKWKIREAEEGDRPAIDALFAEAQSLHVDISPGFFRRGKPSWSLNETNEVILVALSPLGIVCGLSRVQLFETPDSPVMVKARRGQISDIVVAKAHRRRGCGAVLVEASREWAKARGASMLLLTVWEGNRAAEKFYRKLGFERVSQVLGNEL